MSLSSEIESMFPSVTCSKCNIPLPLFFYRDPIKALGQGKPICIDCKRKYDREYYKNKTANGYSHKPASYKRKHKEVPEGAIKRFCRSCGKLIYVLPGQKELTCEYCSEHFNISWANESDARLWKPKQLVNIDEIFLFISRKKVTYGHEIMRQLQIKYHLVKKALDELEDEGKITVNCRCGTKYVSVK